MIKCLKYLKYFKSKVTPTNNTPTNNTPMNNTPTNNTPTNNTTTTIINQICNIQDENHLQKLSDKEWRYLLKKKISDDEFIRLIRIRIKTNTHKCLWNQAF